MARSFEASSKAKAARVVAAICLLVAAICFLPTAYCLMPDEPGKSAPALVNKEGWREAEAGYRYSFPRDHASHEDYGIEWWYYTGNVETKAGRRFGFQLTFFRVGVVREPTNPSRWAVRNLYMAHFAISDLVPQQFHAFERI